MLREISGEDERGELRKTTVEHIAPGSEVEKAGVRGSERPQIRFGIKGAARDRRTFPQSPREKARSWKEKTTYRSMVERFRDR